MNIKKTVTILLFAFFSISAHAGFWTGKVEFKNIRIHPNYTAIYLRSPIAENSKADISSCKGPVLAINRNSSIYDDVLAVLLAESMSSKKINFYITGCNWGYMEFDYIWFGDF